MTKRALRWWLMVAGAVAVLVMVAILAAPLLRPRESARSDSCLGNMKQKVRALLMCAQENDQRLPPAEDWQARLVDRYANGEHIFVCVEREDEPGPYFALSPYVTWRRLDEIEAPETVVMVYEVDGAGEPVFPHDGGAHYGFADGRSKWLSQEDAQNRPWALPQVPGQRE